MLIKLLHGTLTWAVFSLTCSTVELPRHNRMLYGFKISSLIQIVFAVKHPIVERDGFEPPSQAPDRIWSVAVWILGRITIYCVLPLNYLSYVLSFQLISLDSDWYALNEHSGGHISRRTALYVTGERIFVSCLTMISKWDYATVSRHSQWG